MCAITKRKRSEDDLQRLHTIRRVYRYYRPVARIKYNQILLV